jgi:hypothetical protein
VRAIALVAWSAACGHIDIDPWNAFTQLPLLAGGDAGDITRAADGTLYVLFNRSTVWKTSDVGRTWTQCAPAIITDIDHITVDPATGALYTGSDIDVLASTDGCASWHRTGLDLDADRKVAALGGDALAGTPNGLWRFHGGAWSAVATPADGTNVRWVAADTASHRAYAAADNGVARSLDGGQTWSSSNVGFPAATPVTWVGLDPSVLARAFAISAATLYKSEDSGDTWSSLGLGSTGVASDPRDPDFVLLYDATSSLVVSTDGGATFDPTDRRSAEMNGSDVAGAVFDPATSEVFVACSRGVYAATDHALQWRPIHDTLSAWSVGPIAVADTGEIYVPTDIGVERSFDGGATWDLETAGLPERQVNGVAVVPDAPGSIVATDGPYGSRSYIVGSTDRGDSFTTLYTPGNADGFLIMRTRVAGSQVLAATYGGIVISDVTRTIFTHHDVGAPARITHDVIALDAGATQLLAATQDGVFYSNDSGATFSFAGAGLGPSTIYALQALPDGTLLAGGDTGLYRASAPTGAWESTSLRDVIVHDILAADGRVFVATSGGVFVSVDGATWGRIPGLDDSEPISLAVDPSGRLFVGTMGSGAYVTTIW